MFLALCLTCLTCLLDAGAAEAAVTISGNNLFSSLDGSAQDADGLANGVFTVNDDLVLEGTINCNDDPPLPTGGSACPIHITVSGNMTMEAGSAIFAENRRAEGRGGDIQLDVDGDLTLAGPDGSLLGAVISSSRPQGSTTGAGDITISVGGAVDLEGGSVVAASTLGGVAGTIEVTAGETVRVAGLVASGGRRTVAAPPSPYIGPVLNTGNSGQTGGPISLRANGTAEPALLVEPGGIVVSQGEGGGARLVQLEACGIEVRGLVASISRNGGPSQVVLRSGRGILVDGQDLDTFAPGDTRLGRLRADSTQQGAAGYLVDLFATGDIQVLGPDPSAGSAPFAVSSTPGSQPLRNAGGNVTAISLAGTLTATGKAFETGNIFKGDKGGTIDLQAQGDVDLDGATLRAVGESTATSNARAGGHVDVRSFSGSVTWTFGLGDVRPTGTGVTAANRGTIELTACTTIDVTGTQFPVNGAAVPPFPVETEGVCSPAAPSLPAGEPELPECNFNQPPAPTGGPFTLAENSANGTVVGTVAANDPDVGQTHTFAITAGNTGGAFAIDSSTGQITVANSAALDFETTPTFNLTVEVTDNGTPPQTGTTTVVVNLTDVNEAPTDIALDNASVAENQPPGTAVGNFSTTDPDAGDTHTYSLVDTATFPDNAAFTIVGNQLQTAVVFDFEAKSSYTIRVRSTDAGGLFFEETFTITIIDGPDAPIADDDLFDFIGNTELLVDRDPVATPHARELTLGPPTLGVLDGDVDPEGGALMVSMIIGCADLTAPFTCPTANGGTVVMESDGRFSFTPKAGDTAATDSFQYEVKDPTNATDTATVTLTRFRQAWYVNNTATGGTGRSNDPFGALASVPPASVADDYIFVHFGDGTSGDQDTGIVLKNGQHLIGEHIGFAIPISINGNPSPTNLFDAVAGNRPLIDNTGGNAVAATDAIPVEIVGLSLSGNLNAIDLTTNGPFGGGGTTEIKNNIFRGAGAEGIDVNAGGSGALVLDVQGNSWSAGTHAGNAVDIARNGGTLQINFSNNTGIVSNLAGVVISGGAAASTTITGFSSNSVHESTGGTAIMVSNATFDSNTGAANLQAVGGGNTSIGIPGDAVGGAGLVLSAVTGALDFADLDVFAGAGAGGAGVSITGTGAFTGAAGTRLTVIANAGIVESTGGPAVDANNATIDLRLTSIKVNSSPTTGVSLVNVSDGSVLPAEAHFSAGTTSSIASTTGTDFNVDGGNATVSYAGSITNSAGRSVSVTNRTGDSVTFTSNSTINDTGTGIQVNSNAAGAVTDFLGTLTLSTGANAAFAANSGGTLRVMGAANTIATTTGTALNLTNTTIGAGSGAPETGLRFRSISAGTAASGPTNGIVLNTTGASGSLTVTGTGGAGTGGTLQRGATGISLTSTQNVSLAFMQLNDFTDFAIRGNSVVGFTLSNTVVNGTHGDNPAADEGCVRFTGLTGSAAVSNSSFSGSVEDTFSVVNSSGTLDRITFTNVTFASNHSATGDNGLRIAGSGSAVIKTTIQNSFFTGTRGDHLDATLAAGSTGSLDVVLTSNAVSNNHPSIVAGGGGVLIGGVAGTVTYNVSGTNTFRDGTGDALVISCGGTGSVCTGRIDGAQIGVQAVTNSGSSGGSGIALVSAVGGSFTALLNNNVIRQYNNHGIRMQAGDLMGNPLTYNVTVTNNTVGNPGTINTDFNGIHLNNGTVGTDNFTACIDIRNNSIAGSGSGSVAPNNADYRLRQRQSTTVRLPGYAGANNNDAAVVAFVSGNQTTVSTGAASNTVATGGGGFVGGASCPTPL